MVRDRPAACVRHREGNLFFEHVTPGLLGCVREVEDDAEFAESANERSAAPVGAGNSVAVVRSRWLLSVVDG
jgi:hypothetical protein